MTQSTTNLRLWKWAIPLAIVAGLGLAIIFFPWNWLRGPIGNVITEKTGRTFVIAGNLDVKLRPAPRIRMQGHEIGIALQVLDVAHAVADHLIQQRERAVVRARERVTAGGVVRRELVLEPLRLGGEHLVVLRAFRPCLRLVRGERIGIGDADRVRPRHRRRLRRCGAAGDQQDHEQVLHAGACSRTPFT